MCGDLIRSDSATPFGHRYCACHHCGPEHVGQEKECCLCGQGQPKEDYSYMQWYKPKDHMCKACYPEEVEQEHLIQEERQVDQAVSAKLWNHNGIQRYCFDDDTAVGHQGVGDLRELVGTYAVIFMRYCTSRTEECDLWGDVSKQQRTLTRSSARLGLPEQIQEEDHDDDQVYYLCGELSLHEEDIKFSHQIATHWSFKWWNGHGEYAEITTEPACWGGSDGAEVVGFQRVGRNITLEWIPNDEEEGDSEHAQQRRQEIMEDLTAGPLLWLCHHKSIPEPISELIHSFMFSKPDLGLDLREDDIVVTIEVEEFPARFEGQFVLRRTDTMSSSSDENCVYSIESDSDD